VQLKSAPCAGQELPRQHAVSLYHPFDRQGRRHMEYVMQRGTCDDLPLAGITADTVRETDAAATTHR
jgi:hypothetical protein